MIGIGGHQSPQSATNEWLTPPHIISELGPFDLDPCAPVSRPWDTAREHYTIHDNGLAKPWHGRVWLNPPYGRATAAWVRRLADHGDGIALLFARTETDIFFPHVWRRAELALFLHRRLHFHLPDGRRARGNAGGPSVLVAYGGGAAERLVRAEARGWIEGALVRINTARC